MLITRFSDQEKCLPEFGSPGVKIGGVWVYPQFGMIYWYRRRDHTFDIRIMRKLLGLPETVPADTDLEMPRGEQVKTVLCGLRDAVGQMDFDELMRRHDEVLEAAND